MLAALPEPIELPEQRAVFFPELVGHRPPPPAPPLMPPPLPIARRAPPPIAAPDDDDRSVASASSAALGIESSATSFSARDDLPTATTSKYWGVSWSKSARLWEAYYKDANCKKRTIGKYGTQEDAARAYNAAIRRAGLGGKRRTNPVVDGQLVPREYKRRREEPAASSSRARCRR